MFLSSFFFFFVFFFFSHSFRGRPVEALRLRSGPGSTADIKGWQRSATGMQLVSESLPDGRSCRPGLSCPTIKTHKGKAGALKAGQMHTMRRTMRTLEDTHRRRRSEKCFLQETTNRAEFLNFFFCFLFLSQISHI